VTKRKTISQFIEESNEIHQNKYNYDIFEYINAHTKSNIICNEHGIFSQAPHEHLKGHGCSKCTKNYQYNTKDFIETSQIIHSKKYDYSLVEYKTTNFKIKIICKKHGIFEQTPNSHLMGKGCAMCYGNKKRNINQFIDKSIKTHGKKYNYSLVEYKNNKTKVKITCQKHGIFEQTPHMHLYGQGCPICKESLGENKIRVFLEKNNFIYMFQKTFDDCRYKQQLQFDFYLPKYNMCIEYDGIQHFEPIGYFGGEKSFKTQKEKDNIKNIYCKENNIKLLRISYKDNINKKLSYLKC